MPSSTKVPGGSPKGSPKVGRSPHDVDYAEEGRKLLAQMNLSEADGFGAKRSAKISTMYKHPDGGGVLYVGGQAVAMDRKRLQELGINRVVMCQDRDGRCYFEGEAWVEYHRFPIGKWRSAVGSNPTPPQVVKYFEPHVKYVEAELAKGNNCLIHCLAGAHRAGTATIASLMWMLKIPDNEAIPLAQRMRPVINPIGGYPLLLSRLSAGLQSLWAKAEVPKTES